MRKRSGPLQPPPSNRPKACACPCPLPRQLEGAFERIRCGAVLSQGLAKLAEIQPGGGGEQSVGGVYGDGFEFWGLVSPPVLDFVLPVFEVEGHWKLHFNEQ